MNDGWAVQGTWVRFNRNDLGGTPLDTVGYVFGITPCARAAVLIPYDGFDDVVVLDPEAVQDTLSLDEVKAVLAVLDSAEINSITFDRGECQSRVNAVRDREVSHA